MQYRLDLLTCVDLEVMFRDYIVMDLDVVVPGDMGQGKGYFWLFNQIFEFVILVFVNTLYRKIMSRFEYFKSKQEFSAWSRTHSSIDFYILYIFICVSHEIPKCGH